MQEGKPSRLRVPSAPGEPAGGRALGLRERHKLAKHQRICDATITLMSRNGYEDTGLRDIAREADVALGTLSLYARDKRDLTLMVFNKLIPPLLDEGRRRVHADAALEDNVCDFFQPCYEAYARDVTLYRIILGQIYNGPGSVHAEEGDAIRMKVLGHIADIIGLAVAGGRCRRDVDIAVQTRSFFYIYFTAVRVWLFQDAPEPAQGLASLRMMYAQHVIGLRIGA